MKYSMVLNNDKSIKALSPMYNGLKHSLGVNETIGEVLIAIDEVEINNLTEDLSYYIYENNSFKFNNERLEIINLNEIRSKRREAFLIGDRYQLTIPYNTLTEEQKEELALWRKAWLDAPNTKILPDYPIWMK